MKNFNVIVFLLSVISVHSSHASNLLDIQIPAFEVKGLPAEYVGKKVQLLPVRGRINGVFGRDSQGTFQSIEVIHMGQSSTIQSDGTGSSKVVFNGLSIPQDDFSSTFNFIILIVRGTNDGNFILKNRNDDSCPIYPTPVNCSQAETGIQTFPIGRKNFDAFAKVAGDRKIPLVLNAETDFGK